MDDQGEVGGAGWGPYGRDIREMAFQVLEAANDLRAMEVLDNWGWDDEDHVSQQGDNTREGITGQLGRDSFHDRLLQSQEQEWGYRLGTEFDFVPGLFAKFALGCDLAPYDLAIADLVHAGSRLRATAPSQIMDIREKVSESLWVGNAAMAFRDHIASPLFNVPPNHERLVAELTAALEGYKNLITATQYSALTIATQTRDVLQAAIADGTAPPDLGPMFAVVGTVLAFGAIFVPGSPGFAIGLAILGAALSAAQTTESLVAKNEPKPNEVASTISGTTAHGIILTMLGALLALDAEVTHEEVVLSQELDKDIAGLNEALSSRDADSLRAPRIGLCDGPPPASDFKHKG